MARDAAVSNTHLKFDLDVPQHFRVRHCKLEVQGSHSFREKKAKEIEVLSLVESAVDSVGAAVVIETIEMRIAIVRVEKAIVCLERRNDGVLTLSA